MQTFPNRSDAPFFKSHDEFAWPKSSRAHFSTLERVFDL